MEMSKKGHSAKFTYDETHFILHIIKIINELFSRMQKIAAVVVM